MKCPNCGMTLRENAKFCDVCGERIDAELTMRADEPDRRYDHRDAYESESVPRRYDDRRESPRRRYDEEYVPRRRYAEEDQREALRRRYNEEYDRSDVPRNRCNDEDDYRDAPRRSNDDDYHRDDVPRRRYAEEDQREAPRRRYDDEDDYRGESPRLSRRRERELQRQKKKKKAIVISIIALLLVIAIISGIIVVVSMTSVSAAELQDAKDKYVPPAQAITIDTSLDDPSNDDIRFTYDDRARILSCTYQANGKPYDQRYSYFDKERRVNIETRYRNRPIFTKDIDYGRIKNPNQFEIVDDYYLRLDPPCLPDSPTTASSSSSASPAVEETEAPAATEAPTEASAITETEWDDALDTFIYRFVDFYDYSDTPPHAEYDCRNAINTTENVIVNVCGQNCCIDWKTYIGQDRTWEQGKHSAPWTTNTNNVILSPASTVEWICRNIFNITDDEIAEFYQRAYDNHIVWKEEIDNETYYCSYGGKGGSMRCGKVLDVQTDGRFSYVTYGLCNYDSSTNGPGEQTATYFAVMEKKNIDGSDYWSVYYNTSSVPDEITPFDSEGR